MPPRFVAFSIVDGWRRARARFVGPDAVVLAVATWARVYREPESAFRAVEASGREIGTCLPGDVYDGCVIDRCRECGKEFKAPTVGEVFCVGCDLAQSLLCL